MDRLVQTAWLCIPAHNEAETIGDLVAAVFARQQVYGVVVVDDGSRDDTGRLAHEAGAVVIAHGTARGIAAATMAGWRFALESGASWVAQMDAGGSHDPDDLAGLLAAADGGAEMVIGSRFMRGGQYHGRAWRAGCSRLAAAALNLSQSGGRVRDWTSGYRVFSARAARLLLEQPYAARMHAWQIEVLARARLAGLAVAEAPICYRAGRSSLRLAMVNEAIRAWLDVVNHMQVHGGGGQRG